MSDKTSIPLMVTDNYQAEVEFNDTIIARMTWILLLLIMIIAFTTLADWIIIYYSGSVPRTFNIVS